MKHKLPVDIYQIMVDSEKLPLKSRDVKTITEEIVNDIAKQIDSFKPSKSIGSEAQGINWYFRQTPDSERNGKQHKTGII